LNADNIDARIRILGKWALSFFLCFGGFLYLLTTIHDSIVQRVIGPSGLSTITDVWKKFEVESAFIAGANTHLLDWYQLAQLTFPILTFVTVPALYWFLTRQEELNTSSSFIWGPLGIPYMSIIAVMFLYLVFGNIMGFQDGIIARKLYGTHFLLLWLPLTYTGLTVLLLQLALGIKFALGNSKDGNE
jgi:hypothetical protein